MNANQRAKYDGHWLHTSFEYDTHRRAKCLYCTFVATERKGPGTNALASATRLFGKIATHLREVHADKLSNAKEHVP